MWKSPEDPGGGSSDPGASPSNQELSDLKDQYEQQQVLIAQLKAMIKKSDQSSVTQENVDEYMNTLSKRAKKKKDTNPSKKVSSIEIPASQKISLLRQQVEENKLRLAERGKNQKGIEDMVTQIKAQLDDSMSKTHEVVRFSTDYSENSPSQELYSILLTKEKKITDLSAKIIDLQDNLKEKDSVIEARTKAITLMTESLNRKGKNTLDTLEDTKEQMRRMQENFVTIEAEMKARQVKLLEDLKLKNYEIAELEDRSSSLETELGQYKSTNETLNERIRELEEISAKINDDGSSQSSPQHSGSKKRSKSKAKSPSHEDFDKLKQENQSLSSEIEELRQKTRVLTDEISALKSQSDDMDEYAKLKKQLDDSNKNMIKVKAQHKSKLKELTKKIEQLKNVSDANAEVLKLQQKITELEDEKGSLQLKLVEGDEGELQKLKEAIGEKDKVISILEAEIETYRNENETLTHQIKVYTEAQDTQQVTSEITSIQLEEQMDSLESERRKLETANSSMVQENEDLLRQIDILKGEKQEINTKLEHYIQENMELIDKLEKLSATEKVSSAESIEIVEGLTQQEKLELAAYQQQIKGEETMQRSVDLNESVNELTEETSELLQKIELFTIERREVMDKMEDLKQENNALNLRIKEIENNRDILAETYEQLQSEKEIVDTKLEQLEKQSDQSDALARKELEISELNRQISMHKATIDQQLEDIERLNRLVQDLQVSFTEKESDNVQLNNKLSDLNRTCGELEAGNQKLEGLMAEIGDLKQQIEDLEFNNEETVNNKDEEIQKLRKELANLQMTLQEKDHKYHQLNDKLRDFTDKYLTLQKQLEENSVAIKDHDVERNKIEELTLKNKEQLEKMKKIAATLKKKNQSFQELEETLRQSEEKSKEKDLNLEGLQKQITNLHQVITIRNDEYETLTHEFGAFKEKTLGEIEHARRKSSEQSLQQEMLQQQSPEHDEAATANLKIQELEMIIETQDSELSKYKDRVTRLEEGISFVEERRSSLEKRAIELGTQLKEKSSICDEKSHAEDFLQERLSALTAHDDIIEKRLDEMTTENQELTTQNRHLVEHNETLQRKLQLSQNRNGELESYQDTVQDLETQLSERRKQVERLETELKTLQGEFERVVEESRQDFDRINNDWQVQFDEVLSERGELLIRCEKFEEELREIADRESLYNEQLEVCQHKLDESERKYLEQIELITKSASDETGELRRIVDKKCCEVEELRAEVESLRTQVKGLENENKRLVDSETGLRQEVQSLNSELKTRPEQQNPLSTFFDNVPTPVDSELESLRGQVVTLEAANRNLLQIETTLREEVQLLKTDPARNSAAQANPLSMFFDNVPAQTDNSSHESLQRQVLELEAHVKSLVQSETDLKREVQSLKSDLERNSERVSPEQLELVLKSSAKETSELRQIIDEKNLMIEQNASEIESLRRIHLTREVEPPPDQHNPLSTFFSAVSDQFSSLVDNKDSEVESLRRQVAALETDNRRLVQEATIKEEVEAASISQPLLHDQQNPLSTLFDIETPQIATSQKPLSAFFDSVPSDSLHPEIQALRTDNQSLLERESAMKHEIESLKRLIEETIIQKTAESAVDSIIAEAEIRATPSVSPQKLDDPELNNKIKTLEFMLYTMEKEKEDALSQCNKLSNELTRLVYEREHVKQQSDHLIDVLESQIRGDEDHPDSGLRNLEFEPTKEPRISDQPVVEDTIQAKDSYLCYGDSSLAKDSSVVDSQIVQDTPIDPRVERLQLQQIEFEPCRPVDLLTLGDSVREDPVSAKEAYLCYDSGAGVEDGWGWSPEEAKLEEAHQATGSDSELRQKIQVLELERERHMEEIKQLQIKSGKLIKKLKEFKLKNEQLSASRSHDDFGLEETIQEEFKQQIAQVEKRLHEVQQDLDKERQEKAGILKRVHVLTGANERMLEMKEKQDVELLGWQSSCRELSSKLQQFEWGDDGFSSASVAEVSRDSESGEKVTSHEVEELKSRVETLNETVKELSLDNDELQALLEEQRTLRIEAEKAEKSKAVEVDTTQLLELKHQLEEAVDNNKQLEGRVNELVKINEALSHQLEHGDLNSTQQLTDENNELKQRVDELVKSNDELSQKFHQLEDDNLKLLSVTNEHTSTIEALNARLINDDVELSNQNQIIESLKQSINSQTVELRQQLADNQAKIDELLNENEGLRQTLGLRDAEVSHLQTSLEQMRQEWSVQIDQRGADVAESWKLHLESRETEFGQLELVLRKEINELEEKCNGLVNENNELRKNVDAEIRNEVDRISALQQQINDRQSIIDELTREIQALKMALEQNQLRVEQVESRLQGECEIVDSVIATLQLSPDERSKDSIDSALNQRLSLKDQELELLRRQLDEFNLKLHEDSIAKAEELFKSQSTAEDLRVQLEQVIESFGAQQAMIQERDNLIQTLQVDSAQVSELKSDKLKLLDDIDELKSLVERHALDVDLYKRRLSEVEHLKQTSVDELNVTIETLSDELNTKTQECGTLHSKVEEQSSLMDEENKQLSELRLIIEDQVIKIEELKKDLFEKSNQYDSLIAEMDISRRHQESAPEMFNETPRVSRDNDDLTEPVNRAELDLALYMLHQRDVRCEELTVELTQLLEERDTLQLRLSNALREKEEMGQREKSEVSPNVSAQDVDFDKSRADTSLATKLSELRTVGYKNDKTIVDQQQMRRLQELSIMQGHRDDASKLPAEAAARLVDASYTLSRDVQSPSKVLLNWLWGKSTPKVNDI